MLGYKQICYIEVHLLTKEGRQKMAMMHVHSYKEFNLWSTNVLFHIIYLLFFHKNCNSCACF
jgi:hypothetical protein